MISFLITIPFIFNKPLPPPKILTVEEKIVEQLGEEFLAIAECESGIRQFKEDGSVLISRTSDKGVFQINQVHWPKAKELGIDLDTVDGNISFAKILKEEGGTGPWYMSRHCWETKV